MKKGNSKNRHCSKGNSLKSRKRLINRKGCLSTVTSEEVQHAEKCSKWNIIATIIQLADFVIDKMPRLIEWLVCCIGMG